MILCPSIEKAAESRIPLLAEGEVPEMDPDRNYLCHRKPFICRISYTVT